jgi:hypothetical protein
MKIGKFEISNGDLVTITDARGAARTGKAVSLLFFADHIVLNMGGKYGTPAVADARNIIAVRKAYKRRAA